MRFYNHLLDYSKYNPVKFSCENTFDERKSALMDLDKFYYDLEKDYFDQRRECVLDNAAINFERGLFGAYQFLTGISLLLINIPRSLEIYTHQSIFKKLWAISINI